MPGQFNQNPESAYSEALTLGALNDIFERVYTLLGDMAILIGEPEQSGLYHRAVHFAKSVKIVLTNRLSNNASGRLETKEPKTNRTIEAARGRLRPPAEAACGRLPRPLAAACGRLRPLETTQVVRGRPSRPRPSKAARSHPRPSKSSSRPRPPRRPPGITRAARDHQSRPRPPEAARGRQTAGSCLWPPVATHR